MALANWNLDAKCDGAPLALLEIQSNILHGRHSSLAASPSSFNLELSLC
jgi:hypothetical protein